MQIIFNSKGIRVYKATIMVANDKSLCSTIFVLFLVFRLADRAEIFHMNRQQNFSR